MICSCTSKVEVSVLEGFKVEGETIHTSTGCYHASLFPELQASRTKAAGMEGAFKLERLFHAQTTLDLWRERYSHAATQIDRWEREVQKRQADSRGEAVQ